MIVGHIVGKVRTHTFTFVVTTPINKFDYVQVYHKDCEYVLSQIIEIEKEQDKSIATCQVIGYKDPEGRIKSLRQPFEPNSEVLQAQDEFIMDIVQLSGEDTGAYLGHLEGKTIPVHLNLQQLLTKHVAVLAKSGAGKSYTVGVLLEEIMEKKVPLLIIDPHGEYNSLKQKNTNTKDNERMKSFSIKAKSYLRSIKEYGDPSLVSGAKPLTLSDEIQPKELLHLLPAKLSSTQESLLYGALKKIDYFSFENLKELLSAEDNNAKWQVISQIEYLESLNIFSKSPISFNELIQTGRCSILNFKGIPPEVQHIVVYKLLKDLFEQRKKNTIPPFFCVIEEAHNYCPEKSFGSVKSGEIIRTIASEGRKFGLGLAVISQRPARVEKSVLSQITTQIILKVTNPNDLKAISQSVEGITSETVNELQNMPIGHALVTGLVDVPLFVDVRPRKTAHGGDSVDMLDVGNDENFIEKVDEFNQQGIQPLIIPTISKKDAELGSPSGKIKTVLVPGCFFVCQSRNTEFNLLCELVGGRVVTDVDQFSTKRLPNLEELGEMQLRVLQHAHSIKKFDVASFMQKTKMGFDVKDILDELAGKQYLIKFSDREYGISDDVILSSLNSCACHKKIVFKAHPVDEMIHKKTRLDSLKARLSRFTTIKDTRDCFIVRYIEVD